MISPRERGRRQRRWIDAGRFFGIPTQEFPPSGEVARETPDQPAKAPGGEGGGCLLGPANGRGFQPDGRHQYGPTFCFHGILGPCVAPSFPRSVDTTSYLRCHPMQLVTELGGASRPIRGVGMPYRGATPPGLSGPIRCRSLNKSPWPRKTRGGPALGSRVHP